MKNYGKQYIKIKYITRGYLLQSLIHLYEIKSCTSDPVRKLDLFLKDDDRQKDLDLF